MTSNSTPSDSPEENKESVEKYIESNTKAIELISQALASSQKQNKKSRLEILILWITAGISLLTAVSSVLTFRAIEHNGDIQLKQNSFEQEQRAVEISLQLATYWETNLNDDTRQVNTND